MKKILLFIAIIIFNFSYAQKFTTYDKIVDIEASTKPFGVSNYCSHLLEMNNGFTVLVGAKLKKENFLLKIFNQEHTEITSTTIKLDNIKKMGNVQFIKMMELNGKAILFYSDNDNNVVKLYKLEINSLTGEFKNDFVFDFKNKKESASYILTIIENDLHHQYAIIYGAIENELKFNLSINIYNTLDNKLTCKSFKEIDDCYELELLDAVMDNSDIYVCLNKKLKPADTKINGPFTENIHYISENKVSLLKVNILNKSQEAIKLNLPQYNYYTKAQLNFDKKNNQVNMLLSIINPKDKYGRIPDATTLFYKFSKEEFNIKIEKQITNQFALNRVAVEYPKLNPDKNTFVNFPQYMATDSLGNNTFLYQTKYSKNDRTITGYTISRDFAFLFTNAKAEVNGISFSQYANINPSNFDKLNYFSFDYNREINPTPIYYCDLYNYSTFEVDNKIVTISNIFTKNSGKSFDDDDLYIKFGGKLMPMELTVNNNYYSYNRVFNESKEYNKLVFNIGTSTYNKNTKTFCVTATEIRGGKERLVWIKFQ